MIVLLQVSIAVKKHGTVVFRASSYAFYIGARSVIASRDVVSGGGASERAEQSGSRSIRRSFTVAVSSGHIPIEKFAVFHYLARVVSSDVCHWPHGLLLRHVAHSAEGYEQATQWLVSWPLLTPSCFIVRDGQTKEGTELKRGAGACILSATQL